MKSPTTSTSYQHSYHYLRLLCQCCQLLRFWSATVPRALCSSHTLSLSHSIPLIWQRCALKPAALRSRSRELVHNSHTFEKLCLRARTKAQALASLRSPIGSTSKTTSTSTSHWNFSKFEQQLCWRSCSVGFSSVAVKKQHTFASGTSR